MDLKLQVKHMIIERLRLKITPEEIDDNAPLFGDGLALDSIDALELSIAIEKTFGAEIKNEDDGREAFRSINHLAAYIEQHRA